MSNSNKDSDSNDVELPLVQHLKELRDRLLKCILTLVIVFAALFSFNEEIFNFIKAPLEEALPEGNSVIFIDLVATVFVPIKITFYTSILITMPIILYQIWGFIAPALYRKEKRMAIPLFVSTVALFYAGAAFAYFVLFNIAFKFMVGMAFDDAQVLPDAQYFLSLVLKLVFAFGLAFEIPVATVLLIWAGVVSPQSLAKKRPYVFIGCFVFGMLLTPPDFISQTILAIPMWLLFEAGIFFGRWVRPMEGGDEEELSAEESGK